MRSSSRLPTSTTSTRRCRTLARAHARTGDRIAIAAYLGNGDSFDRALVEFSAAFAGQNERDYQSLSAAVEAGKVAARSDL
jgi:hypothetical protein